MRYLAIALALCFVSAFTSLPLAAAVKATHPAKQHAAKAKKSKVKAHKAQKQARIHAPRAN
jgi:hypothetical protein